MKLGETQVLYMIQCLLYFREIEKVLLAIIVLCHLSFMEIFGLFWTPQILSMIVKETNRYANAPLNEQGKTKGRPNWDNLTISGLIEFMVVALYMGLRVQPNLRTYWMRDDLFKCPTILNIFTRCWFVTLMGSLHLTNLDGISRNDPAYDKIGQRSWLVNSIRDQYKLAWNLRKYLTIDEMMIRHKGSYSLICQYIPNKLQK